MEFLLPITIYYSIVTRLGDLIGVKIDKCVNFPIEMNAFELPKSRKTFIFSHWHHIIDNLLCSFILL